MPTAEPRMPTWVTAAADQRAAKITESFEELPPSAKRKLRQTVIMTMLTEPSDIGSEFDDWDKQCDNCGKICHEGLECRVVGSVISGINISMTVGACPDCWAAP